MHLHLLSFVDAEFINFTIILGSDEIESTIVTKCSPFCVDQHLILAIGWTVIKLGVVNFLNITCVAASSCSIDEIQLAKYPIWAENI